MPLKQQLIRTALSLACTIWLPVAQAAEPAALMQAASAGLADKVSGLLAQGVHPDLRDADGRTALMLAARAGHYETVRRLLIAGADKKLQDKNGKTALDLAAEQRHADLVALMQEAS